MSHYQSHTYLPSSGYDFAESSFFIDSSENFIIFQVVHQRYLHQRLAASHFKRLCTTSVAFFKQSMTQFRKMSQCTIKSLLNSTLLYLIASFRLCCVKKLCEKLFPFYWTLRLPVSFFVKRPLNMIGIRLSSLNP